MANTTTTATTRSFYSTLNRISQKYNLSSEEKAQVSNFITQNVAGDVNVEFAKSVPASSVYLKIRRGDEDIILAHSSNKADTIYVTVIAAEAPKEALAEQKPNLSDADRDKIIQGTVQHVDTLIYTKVCVDIGIQGRDFVADFLGKQTIKGRIRALPCAVFPEGISAQNTVLLGDYAIEVAFVVNQIDCERHPHVLWVRYTQDKMDKEKAYKVARKEDFRKFWKSNKLPDSILDEVISAADVMSHYRVLVYKTAKSWLDARMKENETVTFFGQNPSGGLDPKKPIGYVIGDKIVITNPEAKNEFKVYEFF